MFCVWFLRLLPLPRRVPSSFFRFLSLFYRARLLSFVHSSTDRTVRASILRGRFRSVSKHHHVIHPPRTPRLFPLSFLRLVRLFVPRRRVETNGAFVGGNRPPPMRPSPELRTHTPPLAPVAPHSAPRRRGGGDEGGRTALVPAPSRAGVSLKGVHLHGRGGRGERSIHERRVEGKRMGHTHTHTHTPLFLSSYAWNHLDEMDNDAGPIQAGTKQEEGEGNNHPYDTWEGTHGSMGEDGGRCGRACTFPSHDAFERTEPRGSCHSEDIAQDTRENPSDREWRDTGSTNIQAKHEDIENGKEPHVARGSKKMDELHGSFLLPTRQRWIVRQHQTDQGTTQKKRSHRFHNHTLQKNASIDQRQHIDVSDGPPRPVPWQPHPHGRSLSPRSQDTRKLPCLTRHEAHPITRDPSSAVHEGT